MLENPDVIKWCYKGVTTISLINTANKNVLAPYKQEEKNWGNNIMGTINIKQWTTRMCQNIVFEALVQLGRKNVRSTTIKKGVIRRSYDPDLECDNFVYEVKGRSWCTTGTAGEKVLGVPLKYGEIPSLYKKPLKVILIGYQEYEARHKWQFGDLFDPANQTLELKEALAYHKQQGIEFIAFTDMLKELGYNNI